MRDEQTYTISEVSQLTGLHRNTIRTKIRVGALDAQIRQGKFGDEYRVSRDALVRGGLIPGDAPEAEPAPEAAGTAPDLDSDLVGRPVAEDAPTAEPNALTGAVAALSDLYQRHEQAMFRLGYLQGELERAKALAETAESLQQAHDARSEEVATLRAALQEQERRTEEAEHARRELEAARAQLREMERLREDLNRLAARAEQQEDTIEQLEQASRRPFWQFWKRS
jgi:excisionase family DNA binding protein